MPICLQPNLYERKIVKNLHFKFCNSKCLEELYGVSIEEIEEKAWPSYTGYSMVSKPAQPRFCIMTEATYDSLPFPVFYPYIWRWADLIFMGLFIA